MSTQDLSKMGSARVSIKTLGGVNCVLKQGASEVEIHFYQSAAPKLKGINTPRLLKIDRNHLYIEHIPNSISLKDLRTKSDLFSQLAALHCSEYTPTFEVKKHEWTAFATDDALKILNLPDVVESSIKRIQALSDSIFECKVLISGDTNDGNWGTRANGDLVLFDWERFGQGSPAIDLAPLVSGLGSIAEYKEIVTQYIKYNPALSKTELLEHLIIAKCWIVIEVVNILNSRNNPEQGKYINWYRANIPKWLASVEDAL
ncbi:MULTISPECIES: phosphotransferase family protein [unclassified Vibrio]|uniref:phosphotransferase family protein n=1 Tax=unclassified Vibrio TaxID=2614977 RepID=UPI001E5011D6|nr:choline kinase [Vibrio sp. F13]MCC4892352.1 choline kinase [Vibrio sp. F13]